MHRAIEVLAAGTWGAAREAGTVTLDWEARHRRRFRLTSDQGQDLLLDLAAAARLADGDGLVLDDGIVIRVVAAAEELLEIRAGTAGLPRLAYHLGNRHLKVEILPEALIIRADPVIEEMVRQLGGIAAPLRRPFSPEPGAYGGGHLHE
jgi:urease accessory protein